VLVVGVEHTDDFGVELRGGQVPAEAGESADSIVDELEAGSAVEVLGDEVGSGISGGVVAATHVDVDPGPVSGGEVHGARHTVQSALEDPFTAPAQLVVAHQGDDHIGHFFAPRGITWTASERSPVASPSNP